MTDKPTAEEISQAITPTGDEPRFKPQLAPARTATFPESSYEKGLRRARELLEEGHQLKEVNIRQACFIQAIMDGASQGEAYRFAYDQPHEKPSIISNRASDLLKKPEVAYELFTQRRRAEERILRDRTQAQKFVIEHLQRIVETPGPHHAARVNALGLIGKYAGMFGSEGAAKDSAGSQKSTVLEKSIMAKLMSLGINVAVSASDEAQDGVIDVTPTQGTPKD